RQGELLCADRHARHALTLMSARSWGVFITMPLTVLVGACTAMGRHDEALDYLRLPVPDAAFHTTLGLHYLQARGIYYRTNGGFVAALRAFQSCGELMHRWGVDLPSLLAWRNEAALTWLSLGDIRQARELARWHLDRPEAVPNRVRGSSLRILAATSE